MIDKVRITRFGQFNDREFELGPVTVFVGPNEAGKTTVFDALVEAICIPSEATGYGKQLKQRYGDRAERVVEAEPSPAEAPDAVEFLNVQAIRSDSLALEFSGKNWIERLRGALFTGGLNPSSMADQLRSEENRQRKVGKKTEDGLAAAQRSLAELQAERQHVLERRTLLKADEDRVSTLALEEVTIRREIARIEGALALQRSHYERHRTVELLEAITQQRRLHEEVEKLAPFDHDSSEEIASARRQVLVEQGLVARAELQAQAAEERAAYLVGRAGEAEARGREAEVLRGHLVELQARVQRAPRAVVAARIAWSMSNLLVAGAIAFAGIAGSLVFHGSTGVVVLTAGLVAGAIVAILARRHLLETNTTERDRFVETLDIELAGLLNRPIGARDAEGLAGDIAGAIAEARTQVEAARTARGLADEARRVRDDATAALGPAQSTASNAAAEVSRLFQTIGVADEEELGAKRARLSERRRMLSETAAKLSTTQVHVGAESVDQLETLLRARLAQLDGAIDGPELAGDAARRLEPDLASQRQRLDDKLTEERSLAERLSGAQGEVRATLGKLPEEIANVEKRVGALEAEREASVLAARADELAASVFDSVAQDAQSMVQLLAAETSVRVATMVSETTRSVEIGKLEDPKTFMMTDAGGTSRPLEYLSRGTRDAFLFAMRLALAEKLVGSVRVLLLDDPFGALDPGRVTGLLALLDDFRKRADFQLILFTKEPALLAAVERVFAGVKVYVLPPTTALVNLQSTLP